MRRQAAAFPDRPQTAVSQFFRRRFGFTPTYQVTAPGALELLGNHTGDHQGLVLSVAVGVHFEVAASPRTDGRIELRTPDSPLGHQFWMSKLDPDPGAPWANPAKTLLRLLRGRGIIFGGFNAALLSPSLSGIDLSHATAALIGMALVIRQLYPYTLTDTGTGPPPKRDRLHRLTPMTMAEKMALSRLCRLTEGNQPRIPFPDPQAATILCGREFNAVQVDCLNGAVEHFSLVGNVGLVILPTGLPPEKGLGPRAALRTHCNQAARALGVKSLRNIDLELLKQHQHRLSEREYRCAYHITKENQRVVGAETLLQNSLLQEFGKLMDDSHNSSSYFYQNSCPELDLLVDLATRHSACLGAKLTGNGFGGATVNLVDFDRILHFQKVVARQYEFLTGRRITPLHCRVVNGAQ